MILGTNHHLYKAFHWHQRSHSLGLLRRTSLEVQICWMQATCQYFWRNRYHEPTVRYVFCVYRSVQIISRRGSRPVTKSEWCILIRHSIISPSTDKLVSVRDQIGCHGRNEHSSKSLRAVVSLQTGPWPNYQLWSYLPNASPRLVYMNDEDGPMKIKATNLVLMRSRDYLHLMAVVPGYGCDLWFVAIWQIGSK